MRAELRVAVTTFAVLGGATTALTAGAAAIVRVGLKRQKVRRCSSTSQKAAFDVSLLSGLKFCRRSML